MEARELRIGNWVSDIPNRALQINLNHFMAEWFWDAVETGNIQAISITKEWLLNFGFVQVQDSLYKKHEFFYNLDLNHFLIEKSGYVIEFVHQLQNLYFALTEDELELKR